MTDKYETSMEPALKKIVHAINKAIVTDSPYINGGIDLATNNYRMHMPGDCVNTNLLHMFDGSEGIEAVTFQRGPFELVALLDIEGKRTYTISTEGTLRQGLRKKQGGPHYVQSMLFVENQEPDGISCHEVLSDEFSSEGRIPAEWFERDFVSIFGNRVDSSFTHYVVAYTRERGVLQSVDLVLCNDECRVVKRRSLQEYINADMGGLTVPEYKPEVATGSDRQPLTRLRRENIEGVPTDGGIVLQLRATEDTEQH